MQSLRQLLMARGCMTFNGFAEDCLLSCWSALNNHIFLIVPACTRGRVIKFCRVTTSTLCLFDLSVIKSG